MPGKTKIGILYNRIIKKLITQKKQDTSNCSFHIVDMAEALIKIAYKRNGGHPTYDFPEEVSQLSPMVNSKYYRTENSRLVSGGLFSLDGVHPSGIGQGLIAHEFLKVMKNQSGINIVNPINWQKIIGSDDLYSRPLDLVNEFFQHDALARLLLSKLRTETEKIDD